MSICVHRLTLQWARIWNEKTTKIENFFIWQESWKTSCLLESCMIYKKKSFESFQFCCPSKWRWKVSGTSKLQTRLSFWISTTQEKLSYQKSGHMWHATQSHMFVAALFMRCVTELKILIKANSTHKAKCDKILPHILPPTTTYEQRFAIIYFRYLFNVHVIFVILI